MRTHWGEARPNECLSEYVSAPDAPTRAESIPLLSFLSLTNKNQCFWQPASVSGPYRNRSATEYTSLYSTFGSWRDPRLSPTTGSAQNCPPFKVHSSFHIRWTTEKHCEGALGFLCSVWKHIGDLSKYFFLFFYFLFLFFYVFLVRVQPEIKPTDVNGSDPSPVSTTLTQKQPSRWPSQCTPTRASSALATPKISSRMLFCTLSRSDTRPSAWQNTCHALNCRTCIPKRWVEFVVLCKFHISPFSPPPPF